MSKIFFILSFLFLTNLYSAEVDNFSTNGFKKSESIYHLNTFFNKALYYTQENFRPRVKNSLEKEKKRFVREFKKNFGKKGNVTKFKKWLLEVGPIDNFKHSPHVYQGVGGFIEAGLKIKKPSGVITANGIPIGTDKLLHFFEGGYGLWAQVNTLGWKVESAIKFWAYTEDTFLGDGIGGVYSNGDLVADYEGYLFYKYLVNSSNERMANVTWQGHYPVITKPIDLRVHINSYWNEAMNPSSFRPSLQNFLKEKLKSFCHLYLERPELYLPKNERGLKELYKHIGMRENPNMRMDSICK